MKKTFHFLFFVSGTGTGIPVRPAKKSYISSDTE
jgi:hypothetical protein